MVSCTKYDIEQDYAEFYADTQAEMSNLPDLTHSGKAQLQNINHVSAGSACLLANGDVYILAGSNTWIKLSVS